MDSVLTGTRRLSFQAESPLEPLAIPIYPRRPSTAPQHGFMVVSWRVAAVSALDPSLASMVRHQSSRLDSGRAGAGTGRTGGHRGEAALESVLSSLPFLALTRMPAYAVAFALYPP